MRAAAAKHRGTNLGAILQLWIGDNFRLDGHHTSALEVYADLVANSGDAGFLGHPIVPRALEYMANCWSSLGRLDRAIESLVAVTRTPKPDTALSFIWFEIGALYEALQDNAGALVAYARSITATDARPLPSVNWVQQSRRAIARLTQTESQMLFNSATDLAMSLQQAILTKDAKQLRKLAPSSGFYLGSAACDATLIASHAIVEKVIADVIDSPGISFRDSGCGQCGNKQAIETFGWSGKVLNGVAFLLLEQTASGWLWAGVSVASATHGMSRVFEDQLPTHPKYGNQPPEIQIKSPWPAGTQNFAAGGFVEFVAVSATAFALGALAWWPLLTALSPSLAGAVLYLIGLGHAIAEAIALAIYGFVVLGMGENTNLNVILGLLLGTTVFGWLALVPVSALSPCGFGVRGFYYGGGGHTAFENGVDATFAIDFTRNVPGLPFVDSAENERVLAVADGIITAGGFIERRNSTNPNWTELTHVSRDQFYVLDSLFRGQGAGTPLEQFFRNPPANIAQAVIRTGPQRELPPVSSLASDIVGSRPRRPVAVRPELGDATGVGVLGRRTSFGISEEEPRSSDSPTVSTQPASTRLPYIPNFGRYSSRYLHMQPGGFVSLFQMIRQGNPIGQMGNTGRSAVPHLHFELHDLFLVRPSNNRPADPLGFSIRPSPMDITASGLPQELLDQHPGKCVSSTNEFTLPILRFPR
ncbi:MAG: M23 family metallopeptidase [Deltaproteobacteria bacterium]|nr:M23 family metallopeptidase [Deltaproteobacteria bacterium]